MKNERRSVDPLDYDPLALTELGIGPTRLSPPAWIAGIGQTINDKFPVVNSIRIPNLLNYYNEGHSFGFTLYRSLLSNCILKTR